MQIIIEEPKESEEEQIIFRCREMTPELLQIIARLKAQEGLVANLGTQIHRIRPSDIYYIEVVENKTFFYCKEAVYESKQKLYELEESLANSDMLRISKSVMLNLSKIKSLSPALNGRFEAILDKGERVIISRQYVAGLKKRLGI